MGFQLEWIVKDFVSLTKFLPESMNFYRVLKINFLLMVKTKTSPEGSYLKLNYLNGIRIFYSLLDFFMLRVLMTSYWRLHNNIYEYLRFLQQLLISRFFHFTSLRILLHAFFKIRRVCCQIQEVMWSPVRLVLVMKPPLCASENSEWTWPSFRLQKNRELFNICSNQTIRIGL